MSAIFDLYAKTRTDIGKGASRRLRRTEDAVPAVVYGGEKEAQTISLEHREVLKAIKHEAFFSHILTLHIDEKPQKVVIKDMHRHPYKPIVMHIDFQRVSNKQKLHMHAPIHFINEDIAPGVKAGGIVEHSMKEIEISCLPADLPEYIEVDIATLELDESIHLSQIKAPKGVEFLAITHGEDPSLAAIHMPKAPSEPEVEETDVEADKAIEASDEASTTEENTEDK
ncbi:MAG: 50S ribosomal protein L25/general stress protein Ctc [Legionellales bacterium]|nr:50S ribosomal protein L25/general stress protein Ctc [Legionellales bacterium]